MSLSTVKVHLYCVNVVEGNIMKKIHALNDIQVYNSMSNKLEPLVPLSKGIVKIYICGITVYNFCHVGHARTQLAVDFIIRYLKYKGLKVIWVRNITDIDDKIIREATRLNTDINSLCDRMIGHMHADFRNLNLLKPDFEPRATHYIAKMIEIILGLITGGYAYIADSGDVMYKISSFGEYGLLSNYKQKGGQEDDFVLWKLAKDGEPSFDSPWGKGRPGWHIECSAMSHAILGRRFDLHLGGRDLKFPHHENEIAQSTAYHGCCPARTWMHIGMLNVNGSKMSKSLNNFIDIKSLLDTYSANVVRYFFAMTKYSKDVSYSEENLNCARSTLNNLLSNLEPYDYDSKYLDEKIISQFEEHMSNDFNTPAVNALLTSSKARWNLNRCSAARNSILRILDALGFELSLKVSVAEIEELILERANAKSDGNFQRSDEIRSLLKKKSIVLSDQGSTTTWKQIH